MLSRKKNSHHIYFKTTIIGECNNRKGENQRESNHNYTIYVEVNFLCAILFAAIFRKSIQLKSYYN